MSRYKKIELKDFSAGNGFGDLIDKNLINNSENIAIDLNSNKALLAKSFSEKVVLGNATLAYFLKKGSYIYTAYTDDAGKATVKKFSNNSAHSAVYTFAVDSFEIYGFWKFKEFLLITTCDPAFGAYGKSYYSINNGGAWTDISAITDFGIDDILEVGDYAYLITTDLTTAEIKIQKTLDFATFTEILNVGADEIYGKLFVLDNIVFFTEQINGHCKIFAIENSQFRQIYNEKTNLTYRATINGRIYFTSLTSNYLKIHS